MLPDELVPSQSPQGPEKMTVDLRVGGYVKLQSFNLFGFPSWEPILGVGVVECMGCYFQLGRYLRLLSGKLK